MQNLGHRSDITLRYGATHDPGIIATVGTALQILVPGLVVTITNPAGFHAWIRGWILAADVAARVWPDGPAGEQVTYPVATEEVISYLRISGNLPIPYLQGVNRRVTPGGRGRLTLRLARVTVVMDHGAAWESQWETWKRAHSAAHALWPSEVSDLESLTRTLRRWARRPEARRHLHGG